LESNLTFSSGPVLRASTTPHRKDIPMSKLTASQRSAIRAGAQDFARRADLDVNVEDAEFSDLASLKADARRAARDLAEQVANLPERRAAETEAAQAAILDLVDLADTEMDSRTARGDRSPTSRIDPRTAAPMAFRESTNGGGQEAYALRSGQPVKVWAQARGMAGDDLSVGQYLRALTAGARSDAEHRALAEGTDAAGGHTVPTVLSSELIDLARSNMVLDGAGARTVPLDSDQNVIARVASDPTPAFRAENDAVNESDPTFARVLMEPKSIAVLVKASV
jgi:HK97 family phage major capsid protein